MVSPREKFTLFNNQIHCFVSECLQKQCSPTHPICASIWFMWIKNYTNLRVPSIPKAIPMFIWTLNPKCVSGLLSPSLASKECTFWIIYCIYSPYRCSFNNPHILQKQVYIFWEMHGLYLYVSTVYPLIQYWSSMSLMSIKIAYIWLRPLDHNVISARFI